MSKLKILFMGTPDFAEATLRALVEAEENVVGVITGEDKRMGRGMKLTPNEVKSYAVSKNLPVYQPSTLKNGEISSVLEELCPDIAVVVAYGKILPKYVLDFPKYGCINIHGSILPKYRGAAPIQRAVLDGERETGVTAMYMNEGLDTGDIISTVKTPIGENETVGELWDRLAALGGKLAVETLDAIENGSAKRTSQDDTLATYAHKLTKEEQKVDFTLSASLVHNKIRGMSPYPAAYALLDGKPTKLYESVVCENDADGNADGEQKPGSILSLSSDGAVIACGSGAIKIRAFKPEGSKKLTCADMINGRKLTTDSHFE